MIRLAFDHDWQVAVGDIPQPASRQGAKAGSSGIAADLTLDEGGAIPIPEHLIAKLGPALVEQFTAHLRSLHGEWRTVQLPDDWTTRTPPIIPSGGPVDSDKAAADENVRKGFLPTGIAWYRKVFTVPAAWDGTRVRLDFDGVMRDAQVYVNGNHVAHHYSGYTGFSIDVSEYLRYGDEGRNVVLVHTDTTSQEGWWAEGGGIYRHVWLVSTDPVHIARHGVFVSTEALTPDGAVLSIQTEVDNDTNAPAEVVVRHTITTPSGTTVDVLGTTVAVAPLSRATISQHVRLDAPEVWSLATPLVHRVATDIGTDALETTFGVRVVEYGPDGLLLNGVLTPINGASCHQDFGGVGVALPDRAHEYRIRRLQETGCNAYRTAHHPPTPELLDACDRLGMLVLDENRRLDTSTDGIADLTELMRRDRNHPSVFMWSLENEELIEGKPMSKRLLRRLNDVAHSLDHTRPTTAATAFGKHDHAYLAITDVAGFNYDGGASGAYRAAHPGAPTIATEDASYMSARGIYRDDRPNGLTSSYDEGSFFERTAKEGGVVLDLGTAGGALGTEGTNLSSTAANLIAHPHLGGMFVWTGFDYRGECAPFGWPAVNSTYGLMDLCGFPKDVAHYWRSRWSTEPVVHALPHWTWPGLEGQALRMVVYANTERVELLVNGTRAAIVDVPATGVAGAAVTYEPGVLEVRGLNRNGEVVVTERRETTGAPVALQVSTDDDTCVADGRDVAIVRVDVVDAEGRVVPDACPPLTFTATDGATVIGTGNGAPNDHVPAYATERPAFNGHALAIVRGPSAPGTFTVRVESPGLRGGHQSISAYSNQS